MEPILREFRYALRQVLRSPVLLLRRALHYVLTAILEEADELLIDA